MLELGQIALDTTFEQAKLLWPQIQNHLRQYVIRQGRIRDLVIDRILVLNPGAEIEIFTEVADLRPLGDVT